MSAFYPKADIGRSALEAAGIEFVDESRASAFASISNRNNLSDGWWEKDAAQRAG